MTTLAAHEIEPGLVVHLDPTPLEAHSDVTKTAPKQGEVRVGPFLCLAVEGDQSSWAPLTSQARPERLELVSAWRTGGEPGWRERANYLVDGANTYTGPNEAFTRASHPERTGMDNRARLDSDGLAAVHQEIKRQARRAKPHA